MSYLTPKLSTRSDTNFYRVLLDRAKDDPGRTFGYGLKSLFSKIRRYQELNQRDRLREILLGPKKHKELSLEEIRQAGETFFHNAEQIGLYGLSPGNLIARGCRIVGRTAIECKVDQQSLAVAHSIKSVIAERYPGFEKRAVIDLFLGSGSLLYHVAKGLNAAVAAGFETDETVFNLTRHNFSRLGFRSTLRPRECGRVDSALVPRDHLAVVVIDPPWGEGFSFKKGLDLTRTDPPIQEILQRSTSIFGHIADIVFVILTHERTDEQSVQKLSGSYSLLERDVTGGLIDGSNVGYLICKVSK